MTLPRRGVRSILALAHGFTFLLPWLDSEEGDLFLISAALIVWLFKKGPRVFLFRISLLSGYSFTKPNSVLTCRIRYVWTSPFGTVSPAAQHHRKWRRLLPGVSGTPRDRKFTGTADALQKGFHGLAIYLSFWIEGSIGATFKPENKSLWDENGS